MSSSSQMVMRGGTSMAKDVYGDTAAKLSGSMASQSVSGGYFKDGGGTGGSYQKNKLTGE